jgi:hypothetical protein
LGNDKYITSLRELTQIIHKHGCPTYKRINHWAIQALQLVQNSKGTEATRSGWKPGKTTLKPGIDLGGNVCKV